MPTFDGPNLTIILDSGVTTVDVEIDLYSDWKEWMLVSDNAKYPLAFRTIGGDPLTPGIDAGAYFFIQNQNGWRIRPPEEDITILFSGNLAPEDSSLPILVPTIGAFSVLVDGLQPITQSVQSLLTDIQFSSFQNGVSIDVINGLPGTIFPAGTARQPVNNMADALDILISRGFTTYYIRGDLTVSSGSHPYLFSGQGISTTTLTLDSAANIEDASFINATITGMLDGNAAIHDCSINDLNFFNGVIDRCVLEGTITLGGGIEALILDCWSGVPGTSTPIIDFGGTGQSLALRNYNGGITLQNKTGADQVSVDLSSGQIVIDNTVTNGTIVLRGTGKWTNRETYTGGANIINELADGLLIQQLDHSAFNEIVSIDVNTSFSGTTFPNGTTKQPVNNLADALAISATQGINTLEFMSDYTFTAGENVSLKKLQSGPSANVTFTFEPGSITAGTRFARCAVQGTLISPSSFDNCDLFDIVGNTIGVAGTMNLRECLFNGMITLSSALVGTINIVNCSSAGPYLDGSVEQDNPIFDANGADVSVAVRGYSGGMEIRGFSFDAENNLTIDINSGQLTLDSSNTLGHFILRGIANLVDNSNGITIDTLGLVFPNEIQLSSFDGHVYLEPSGGVAGTQFPIGTRSSPVDNLADAKLILATRDLHEIILDGTLVVGAGEDISDIAFMGTNSLSSVVVMVPTCITDRASFQDMIITGTANGSMSCKNVGLVNVLDLGSDTEPSVFNQCIFLEGTIALKAGLTTPEKIQIADCVAGVSSGSGVTFDYNGTDTLVAFRKYSGGLTISNHTVVQTSEIEFASGDLVINASCTAGTVAVKGVASITDNSVSPFVLDTASLVNPADIAQVKQKTSTLPIVIPAS